MSLPDQPVPPRPTAADRVTYALCFLLLAMVMVTPPFAPANELDASWRMAMGRFFIDGLQFGKDVVFTYGPLGFLMGKTYCGLQYHSLLLWQAIQALIFTTLIFRHFFRLQGYTRKVFFAVFLLFGVSYEDALHQMVIALIGFELLRDDEDSGRWTQAFLAVVLAVLALIKFTDLMLGATFLAIVAGLRLWRGRHRSALWPLGWYLAAFLVGWVACRQNPLNLPRYLYNSWEISQGYQETMGIPTPPDALAVGLVAVGLALAYLALFLATTRDRARAVATALAFGAYGLLNFKHGFVRADGHMIGFFYALLLPATGYPALLADDPRSRRVARPLLVVLVLVCIVGVGTAIPGVTRGLLGNLQERFYATLNLVLHPKETREHYQLLLAKEKASFDMPETRAVVGRHSVDVLGFELAAVIYNDFNYRARPVLQTYSAYRPRLCQMNADFYASAKAPDFILLRLANIDQRLLTLNDSGALHVLLQRYEYVLTEKGHQLWRRKPGAYDAAAHAPRLLQTSEIAVGQPCLTEQFGQAKLWAEVDLQPSLLGRLRGLLYKLPIVGLRLQDTRGNTFDYRMPLPMGRSGFIVSPIVDDLSSLLHFAGGAPDRFLRSLTVQIAPGDRIFFQDFYKVRVFSVPPSTAGREYFAEMERRRFHMFGVVPEEYHAQTPISDEEIDGKPVVVFHAPSNLTLKVPQGATRFTGSYGFLAGAYTNGATTDGAVFSIIWVKGSEEIVLFERALDPLNNLKDRGLQNFDLRLPSSGGGRLRLLISPGPRNNFAWDWTAWANLNIR